MPISSNVRITRIAISPRLATRTLANIWRRGTLLGYSHPSMANFVAVSLGTALAVPVRVLRGLADLPAAMDRNMRQTNDLMRQSGEQLALMHAQAEAMLAQMREMHAVAEKLHAGNDPLAQSARLAREQMAATTPSW